MSGLQHPDPRMGDEDEEVPSQGPPNKEISSEPKIVHSRSRNRKEVKLHLPTTTTTSSEESDPKKDREQPEEKSPSRWIHNPLVTRLLLDLQWIPANWSWPKFKPVIRGTIVAFVSVVLLVISRSEHAIGNASFLILIAALLDPPVGSFIEVVEREIFLVIAVCLAWAWNNLGIFLANLARNHIDRNAPQPQVITGEFLEAGPTVILAIFIFIGCFFFLYLKARLGPGPFTVATVFGAIAVDIPMLNAALFPYPNYRVGQAIVIPLSIHAGLSILCAAVIFPTTMTAQYTAAVGAVLAPLGQVLALYRDILEMDPSSVQFATTAGTIHGLVDKAEGGLYGAGAASRLLKRDIVWGRFSPTDIGSLEILLRLMVVRANGMGVYFTLIDPTRERFPMTPAPSAPATPTMSRTPTRPSSPVDDRPADGDGDTLKRRRRFAPDHAPSPLRQSLTQEVSSRLSSQASVNSEEKSEKHDHEHDWYRAWAHHLHRHKNTNTNSRHHDNHLHFSLLQMAHSMSTGHGRSSLHLPQNAAVGVFESQRYVALEATRLGHGSSADTSALFVSLLKDSCDDLLQQCQGSLKAVQAWMSQARCGNYSSQVKVEQERKKRLESLEKIQADLKQAINIFMSDKRLRVLDPYRPTFDPNHLGVGQNHNPPPHKFLFHSYVYQYQFMRFASFLSEILEKIIKLEQERKKAKLWLPTIPLRHFISSNPLNETAATHQSDDEDPDVLQEYDSEYHMEGDLGNATRRDPDAMPPENLFQLLMSWVYRGYNEFFSGNSLFALKAGVLTILLSIPSLLKTSAAFAYGERFVWAVFMAQLTLARWRGDTTFGLVSRVLATFFGCIVGMVLWYISTGSGKGNPYGLVAVITVAAPFLYFGRLYWTGPPMTNIIFFVTIMLIVGYSWQNTHIPIGFNYWGWALAWRRFILVVAGVTAAFLFSFLPPSTTLRSYQRRMMATTVAELGAVYCSIVSYANMKHHEGQERIQILQTLLAIRSKLKRSHVMKTNIVYEFSLRGRWPAERYKKILDLQVKMAYLLSHLMSTVELLEPAWTRAFLKRTRLLDSDFQGDILAVISLISTSLRTGQPLPQITPCPLLDRFMVHTHGLNVIRQEADDDYGLPRTMTIDTLENPQYMIFSVGVTTAFGIIMRLDRLMVATKELVGEQYHIHGVGLTADYRPVKDA